MPSFLIILNKKQSVLLSDDLLVAHITHLKKLHARQQLSFCGSFKDGDSAMLVMQAKSGGEVEELIMEDPFIKAGCYEKFSIQEFTETNNWLYNSTAVTNTCDIAPASLADTFSNLQNNKPQTMSVLFRKLKVGETYEDFHRAWLPPVADVRHYFPTPALVLNAINANDPTEIISVALVGANTQEAIEFYQHYEEIEDLRQRKLEQVTDTNGDSRFCKIVGVDILGS